eukprot:SAG31_NODE_20501_length_572_cov_6.790698_1_plen_53_part_10
MNSRANLPPVQCQRTLSGETYTLRRIWYALILTPGKTIIDALKTRTFTINLFL